MVTGIAVGVATSAIDGELVAVLTAEVTEGSPYTVNAPVSVAVPPPSVTVTAYEPGTVAEVDAKLPVTVVPVVFTTLENVTPGAVVVTVVVPPRPAKVPPTEKVPEAPWPKYGTFWAPPEMLKVAPVITSAAPAAVAIAIGSAAAASKAPAARAFTKWRCIRLGLFINSLHS
jgi:hypothetical protein